MHSAAERHEDAHAAADGSVAATSHVAEREPGTGAGMPHEGLFNTVVAGNGPVMAGAGCAREAIGQRRPADSARASGRRIAASRSRRPKQSGGGYNECGLDDGILLHRVQTLFFGQMEWR